MNKKDALYLAVLSVLTFVVAMMWFPRTTPDSLHYLKLVEIFKGNMPPITATPPYCYRLLMPFIVSLFSTDALLTFCAINVLLSVVLAWLTYFLVKTFGASEFGAFVATGLASVGIMTLSLASVALTDMPAMICIGIALLAIRRKWDLGAIVVVLIVGVAFKEIVIVAAIAWVLVEFKGAHHKRWTRTWNPLHKWIRLAWAITGLSVVIGIHLGIRWLWATVGVPVNEVSLWSWNHLANFIERPDVVVNTFWLGFQFWIPAFLIVIGLRITGKKFEESYAWLWQTGLPFLGLMLVGLFTAYFSLRFIWPLYFSMAPIVGCAATIVWNRISKPLRYIIVRGISTLSALLVCILVVLPVLILRDVTRRKTDRQERRRIQHDSDHMDQ